MRTPRAVPGPVSRIFDGPRRAQTTTGGAGELAESTSARAAARADVPASRLARSRPGSRRTPPSVGRWALVALTAALALLAGGCGGGPAPRAWAANVCTALSPWRTEINTLTSRTQQQMTAKTTPAQAKENLVRLLGGAESASETARSKVEDAGVPDVDGGEAVAKGFVRSLTAMRDAYGRARKSIEGLDAGRADPFYDGVESVMSTLTTEYNQSALDTSSLDSEELRVAFDEVPECR